MPTRLDALPTRNGDVSSNQERSGDGAAEMGGMRDDVSPIETSSSGVQANMSDAAKGEHMLKVRQREAQLFSEAGLAVLKQRALSVIGPAMDTRSRLAKRVLSAESRRKAVIWLRHAADALSTTVASEVACRPGCSACCRQGVLVSEAEADVIGKAIHRTPIRSPPSATIVSVDFGQEPEEMDLTRFDGVPCTFLMGDRCSIWRDRPVMCRLQASFDRDALLCEIVPNEQIQVPYVDARPEKALYLAKVGVGMLLADIRDWFPPNH